MAARKGLRLITMIVVFLAGATFASVLTLKLGLWQPVGAVPSAPPCGEVLVPGASWLGGAGVDVRSNGDKQTTGVGCAYDDRQLYNLEANPPIFGFGWQCVELVNRLYATKGWYDRLYIPGNNNGGAKWLYTYAAQGEYEKLTAHANGSGYKPVPGDLIVHSNGEFGHVAVVDRIEGVTLHAVEQNNSVTGRATYGYDPATGAVSRAGATISGYIHAEKNTGVGPTPPKSTVPESPDVLAQVSFKIVGHCTTAGGTLTAVSSRFTPGGEFEVAAWYPDGRPYPNLRRSGKVRADGSVRWTWPCAGDPPGVYGTTVVDLATGRSTGSVHFRIDPASGRKAPSPPTTEPDRSVPPPTPRTQPTAPSPPSTRAITVYNKVTNGATVMREDDAPAYLSSVTRNYCRRDGCALPGTEMSTGAAITAVCQVQGSRTTNGQDNSSIDDGNPGLYTSTRWYGVRWSDGRIGYISEVWIRASGRGGLGLPGC